MSFLNMFNVRHLFLFWWFGHLMRPTHLGLMVKWPAAVPLKGALVQKVKM